MDKAVSSLLFGLLAISFFGQAMEKPKRTLPEVEEIEEIEPIEPKGKKTKVEPGIQVEALPQAEELEADEAFKELVQDFGKYIANEESAADFKTIETGTMSRIPGIPLPSDLWKIIIQYVASGQTLDEVIANLRALNVTNKYFYALLHNKELVSILFKQILEKFKGERSAAEIGNIEKIARINKAFYDYINDYYVMQDLIRQLYERMVQEFREGILEELFGPDIIADLLVQEMEMPGAQEWIADNIKLREAIRKHDIKIIEELIHKKFDFNLAQENTNAAILYVAIYALDLEVLKLLIQQMQEDDTRFVDLLLALVTNNELKEKIERANKEEKAILKQKLLSILQYLIENQKDLKNDQEGILGFAIWNFYRYPEVIEKLLQGGSSPNAQVPLDLRFALTQNNVHVETLLQLANALKSFHGDSQDVLQDIDAIIALLKRYGATE